VRPARARILCAVVAACLPFAGCGKRGDPLPPLRRDPRPPGQFLVAQRGQAIEVRLTAPTSSVDGVPLEHPALELFQAEGDGPLAPASDRLPVAPGEARVITLPLPDPGTVVRLAARARDGRRVSPRTDVVTLTVQPPPPPPPGFVARQTAAGVVFVAAAGRGRPER